MDQFLESPYEYLKYKIMNAPVYTYPYPHLLIENIFPEEFYAEIMKNISLLFGIIEDKKNCF